MAKKHNVKGYYRSHAGTNDKAIWVPPHKSDNPTHKK